MLRGNELEEHLALESPARITDAVRTAVLERDNYQCVVCGTTGDNRLQLHHVQYRSQLGGHTENNLVVVCFWDHQRIHDGVLAVKLLEVTEGKWHAFVKRDIPC